MSGIKCLPSFFLLFIVLAATIAWPSMSVGISAGECMKIMPADLLLICFHIV